MAGYVVYESASGRVVQWGETTLPDDQLLAIWPLIPGQKILSVIGTPADGRTSWVDPQGLMLLPRRAWQPVLSDGHLGGWPCPCDVVQEVRQADAMTGDVTAFAQRGAAQRSVHAGVAPGDLLDLLAPGDGHDLVVMAEPSDPMYAPWVGLPLR